MEVMKVSEVAQMVRLSEWAVREAIKSGALKAARYGNTYRVRRQDAEAWFELMCVAR